MNATLAKKLRFSDAVYAINTTPKSLRLWLQRGLVKIDTERGETGWTEYSFLDIAILALVRTFVNFGVDVPTASDLAHAAMNFFPKVMSGWKNMSDAPAGVLSISWTNSRLHIWRENDEWQLRCVQLWQSDMGRRSMIAKANPDEEHSADAAFNAELPSGIATLRREIESAPAYISIDVEAILRTAFERADESVNEGSEGDDE